MASIADNEKFFNSLGPDPFLSREQNESVAENVVFLCTDMLRGRRQSDSRPPWVRSALAFFRFTELEQLRIWVITLYSKSLYALL